MTTIDPTDNWITISLLGGFLEGSHATLLVYPSKKEFKLEVFESYLSIDTKANFDEFIKMDFADPAKFFRTSLSHRQPLVLKGGPTPGESDFFRFTVRDDLTGLTALESFIVYERALT